MSCALSRAALAFALAGFATLLSPALSAQTGTGGTPGAPVLMPSDFSFHIEGYDPNQKTWVQLNPTQQQYYFNRARCECAGDTTRYTGMFRIAIIPAATTDQTVRTLLAANVVSSGSARLYAGGNVVNCLVPSSAVGLPPSYCLNLLDPLDYHAEIPGGIGAVASQRVYESPPIPVAWLFNSAQIPVCSSPDACNATSSCASTTSKQTIYFWAETSGLGIPDRTDLMFEVGLVGSNPFAPSDVTAQGENETILVNWGWPAGLDPAASTNFLGVQLFCQRSPSFQVFVSGNFAAAFMTSAATCPDVAPGPSGDLAFANLEPSYLCSGLLPATTTNYRIKGLQNGIAYGVGVAAVDRYGNISAISPADVVYALPGPADGGQGNPGHFAQGCACTLAGQDGGRGALASLGLLGLGVLIFSRARSKR